MFLATVIIATNGVALANVFLPGSSLAIGTAQYSLSSTSGSYKQGDSFSVTIHENSSDPVAFAQMNLDYDSAKLQVTNIDTSNKTFDSLFTKSSSGNIIKLYEAKAPGSPATGDQILGTVTFNVLASSGSTVLKFDSTPCSAQFLCTQIYEPTSSAPYELEIWDGTTTGATYNFTSNGSSSSSSGSTGSKTGTNKSSSPSQTSTPTTSTAPSGGQNPITTADVSQNGYLVAIKVTDSSGKPIRAAVVTIDGKQPSSFDASGTANFVGVTAGDHTVMVTANGKKASKKITVATGPFYKVQTFVVQLSTTNKLASQIVGAIIALVLIVCFIVIVQEVRLKQKQNKELSSHVLNSTNNSSVGPTTPKATVVGSDGKVVKPQSNNKTNSGPEV